MMPNENELVERLYRSYFKKLFIYANAVLRDPEQAKDVVQDTFHEALRRIDVFAKHENPGGWLMNTLKNKLKENERTRRRDLLRLLSLDADFPDESNLPEELVAAQPEPQEESVIEKVERVLTPEEYQLLKRLVFGPCQPPGGGTGVWHICVRQSETPGANQRKAIYSIS